MRISLVVGGLLAVIALITHATARADYADNPEVEALIGEMVTDHGFDAAELRRTFAEARKQDSILEAIARPAEKRLEWHEYRNIFIKPTSIEQGLAFWKEHADALARAEQVYGVPAEYIVAIIGVETRWGRITGRYRVLDALSTLAFDYPPRSKFFRKELVQYLLLAREEKRDPASLKGSYAGAMGYGQFIPSSFRSYAVDFDGDGQRDIWANPTDAIGSVANYFKRHGWRGQGPVATLVSLPNDGDQRERLEALANASLKPKQTVADLRKMGLFVVDVPGAEDASLFRMEQPDRTEYWLGLNDFYVITRYNHSRLYALAVFQLGQLLAAANSEVAG